MPTSLLLLLACIALGLVPLPFAVAGDRITGRPFATRSEVIARRGMAATSHPLATQIAIDVLKQGGNAIDAAIAANAALGLMEPTGSGIGGDLFAIVWDAEAGRLYGLNASGRSPRGLTLEGFRRRGLDEVPDFGPLSVSVPGCVDGWFELHERFGKLPIARVLAPTIHYAEEGFPVSEVIAHYWARGGEKLRDYPGFAETFLPGGRAPRKGEIFRNRALATTLRTISERGRAAFYRGEITERIEAFCKDVGCYLRREDFAAHESEWVTPLSVTYRGYEVWELPPNGQGLAALQMLQLLEPYDIAAMGHNSANHLHHLIEAKKIAYEDRARFYADPDFNRFDYAKLLTNDYAEQRRKLLDANRAAETLPYGDTALQAGDTIYLTVADEDRNMVSLIQSNYRGFGSGLCPPGLGFCLQDRGALFALDPDHPNCYAPGKRPFHTIIPGFLTREGKPVMAFGVMGGDMQPQGHVQILCNILDFKMNVQEAGDAPRVYHTGSSSPRGARMTDGGTVSLESGVPFTARRDLARRGHEIRCADGVYGGYQAIWYDAGNDVYYGASESRKDGCAAGY